MLFLLLKEDLICLELLYTTYYFNFFMPYICSYNTESWSFFYIIKDSSHFDNHLKTLGF